MYKSITVDFKSLKLDQQNPRFVTKSGEILSQNEILKYLIDYESVIELAEGIKQYGGLVPGERLLVLKESNSYIVLEGNRRTSAITLLLNPELIINSLSLSKQQMKKVESFLQLKDEELKNNLARFEVDIVSTRDEASHALSGRHIDGIKKWSQISKMYFYQQHFDAGKSLSELKEFTGESERSIADTLRKYSFLRFVLDSYRQKYPKGKYKDSVFETQIPTELIIQRIFNSLKDRLKFKFSNNYNFLKNHYNNNQLNLLREIFADIASLYWDLEKINTRNLNKVDQFNDVFFNKVHNDSTPESLAIGKLITELEESEIDVNYNNDVHSKDDNGEDDIASKQDVNYPREKDEDNKGQISKENIPFTSETETQETYQIYLDVKSSKQRVKIYNDFDLKNLIIKATDSRKTDLRSLVTFNTEKNDLIDRTIFSGDASLGVYSIQAKIENNGQSVSKALTLEIYEPRTKITTNKLNNDLFTSVTAFSLDTEIELDINNTVNGIINEIQTLKNPEKFQLIIASSVRQLVELSVIKVISDKGLKNHGNTKDNLKFLLEEKFQENDLVKNICKGNIKIKYTATKNLLSSINSNQLWDYLNLITHDSNSSIYSELVEKINKQIFPLLVVIHNYLKIQQ